MGVYTRPRSPWYWLWLENAPPGQQREKTKVRIGTTKTERIDSRALAEKVYAHRLLDIAANVHRLPAERPVIRFRDFAAWYLDNVSTHHKGHEREAQIIPRLVRDFGDRLLHTIDRELVVEWRTRRARTTTTIPAFGSRQHVPKWILIHRHLREHGPLTLLALAAHFRIESRAMVRSFLKPSTGPYFVKVSRGVWSAVGEPSIADRVLPPPTPSTVNREVDVLQQIIAAAVPKYLATSPLEGLPNLPVTPPIRRTMSRDEEARVLAQLSLVDRAIYLVAVDTLTRMGDVLDLKRRDDHGATLDVRDPKNRQPHTVPISTRLRAALDALPIDSRKPEWYFPSRRRAGSESARRGIIAKALKRACEKAGVPYGRAVQGITFHWATRRTGATRIIRATGDGGVALAQRIGNWKDASVLIEIYQETMTEELQQAVEAIGARDSAQSAPTAPATTSKPATMRRLK